MAQDAAVNSAMVSKYRNAGQTCVCANRIYTQDAVYDAFVEKFARKVKALKVGNGSDEGVAQGPLIEAAALAKMQAHLDDALVKGGRVVAGERALGGLFMEPTVVADATADMLRARGDLRAVRASLPLHGGGAGHTRGQRHRVRPSQLLLPSRRGRVFRVSEALDYGMVGINTGIIASKHVPFGIVEQSGLGLEGSHFGVNGYLEIKYLCLGGIASAAPPGLLDLGGQLFQ